MPVARLACRHCGAAWLEGKSIRRLPGRIYDAAYALNKSPPNPFDIERQAGIAARVARLVGGVPRRVLDVGCGNGALLLALRRLWPETGLAGVEPAASAAAQARRSGLDVASALGRGMRADLVIAVNVIEHTRDPLGFLRAIRQAVAPGGRALIICPDGGTPWIEWMMADHHWSLPEAAFRRLAVAAGFAALSHEAAPDGGFQAWLLAPGAQPKRIKRQPPVAASLLMRRRAYVGAWRALDHRLQARCAARVTGFGTGEAMRLLRAYAPGTWARVADLTADVPGDVGGLRRPFVPLAELATGRNLLLGVRPPAQPSLSIRLASEGFKALSWHEDIPR